MSLAESDVEEAALAWFRELGFATVYGPSLLPEESRVAERLSEVDVILIERLRLSLGRINSKIPEAALEQAIRKLTRSETPSLVENNRRFHRMLVDGIDVDFLGLEGRTVYAKVWAIDFDHPEKNDWLAVNQFTVLENRRNRRPDIVLFVNGLPLGVIELKNAADEHATLRGAQQQLETYKAEIPSLFAFNETLIISDGTQARAGTLTASQEWFLPWRTIEGKELAPRTTVELEVLIKGIFEKGRFLDLIRHFIVFESDKAQTLKKVAGYHQFHAVRKAVDSTIQASSVAGDRRAGVVWHTQGSGKSLTMAFYAGKVIGHSNMENPTVVVLTDRNDLDDQLFGVFSACHELLRQKPVQAESRDQLRDLLKVQSGGVVFTTIQKFLPEEQGEKFPLLSDRRNIVVIADEAHRSQYGFGAKMVKSKEGAEIAYGLAKHLRDALPQASYMGFTGTPIELTDKNTRAVFGDYIDIYDIKRAVQDGATVRIYYEGRLAKIALKEEEKPKIDQEFEEVTEGEETQLKEKLKSKWARLEAMVGSEKRIDLIAKDLIEHFERRLEAMDGKAMVVCMSRRICMDLYDAIVKIRPTWHDANDEKGSLKVVMTGNASEGPRVAGHSRNKPRREALAKRFKDPKDPLQLVIVRDMWLTGFDAPCMHTMYLDKPMRGHGLMQAIARVNRVFRDKPGGLVVDYLGLADQLKKALANYTERDREEAGISQDEAVALMLEKFEVADGLLHRFDGSKFFTGTPVERLRVIPQAMEHILVQEEGRSRFMQAVADLSKAFALSVPHEEALNIRDRVGYLQAIRAAFVKTTDGAKEPEELDTALRQIVSRAVSSDKVIDIFAAAGLKTPDISILSDEFLAEVRDLPQKNLALEMLRKLLNDEIKVRARKNVVQARSFAEMLEKSIRSYQNRAIETAQVIKELIELAKSIKAAQERGEHLGLTEDEVAFYDALETNDSAVKVLGEPTLKDIARELVETVRRNVSIDWTVREGVRAKLRVMVKRVLNKYGYPPDKREKATQTVLEQAEALCKDWDG